MFAHLGKEYHFTKEYILTMTFREMLDYYIESFSLPYDINKEEIEDSYCYGVWSEWEKEY